MSELERLRKADVETIKAFLSRTTDNVRPAYGRYLVDTPRRCVFVGTTNAGRGNGYLRDASGNRRFWPVATGKIDLEALTCDRDQLFAEAAAIEATGESLVIDKRLYEEAGRQQALRAVHDPWLIFSKA